MSSSIDELGSRLVTVLTEAKTEIVLVAPFIKASVAETLLRAAPQLVPGVIVTRWRPEEVAAGVTDLEVLDVVSRHPAWTLRLCHRLHAKYYRADTRRLIGSANLTQLALGWRSPSNLELLVEVGGMEDSLTEFESQLLRESIPASEDVRAAVLRAANSLRPPGHPRGDGAAPTEADTNSSQVGQRAFSTWLPSARNPSDIAYALKTERAELSAAATEQVLSDWRVLEMPYGLEPAVADDLVRARLIQHPLIAKLNVYALQPRRFGEMKSFINSWLRDNGVSRDPIEAWQTLMRWLLYFFPDRYAVSRRSYTEVFQVNKGAA